MHLSAQTMYVHLYMCFSAFPDLCVLPQTPPCLFLCTQLEDFSSMDSMCPLYIPTNSGYASATFCRIRLLRVVTLIPAWNQLTPTRRPVLIVVPYELYELYDWGKFRNFMELYEFYILLCFTWRLNCDYYLGLYIGQFRPINTDLSCWQKHVSMYHVLGPMFYAIVTSDNDFFRECYGT